MKKALEFLAPHLEAGGLLMLRLFLALALIVFVAHALMALVHPYPLDYGEAPLVDQALRLARFQNIYRRDLATPPYTITNYPPLYVLLLAPFTWVSAAFGNTGPSFLPGRLLSVLCTLASAYFIGGTVYNLALRTAWADIQAQAAEGAAAPSRAVRALLRKRARTAASLAALMWLAFPYVVEWSSLLRVDMLALAFSTAALYTLTRPQPSPLAQPATPSIQKSTSHPSGRPPRSDTFLGIARPLWVAGLLLVAAVYTRQSYGLAAPFALFVWLLIQDWRQALELAAIVAGIGLLLLLLLTALTGGGFWFHIVTANVNPFEWETVLRYGRDLRDRAPVLLLLAFAYIIFTSPRRRAWWLLLPYTVAATLTAITIGKIGSNVNYLLELTAALSLVTGVVFFWRPPLPQKATTEGEAAEEEAAAPSTNHVSRTPLWFLFLRAALLIAIAFQVGLLTRTSLQGPVEALKWRLKAAVQLEYLRWRVGETEQPILADEYMGMLTLNKRPLYLQPFEMTQLANAGVWDQTPLLAEIQAQNFPLVLIHLFGWPVYQTRWTPEMLDAITNHYLATNFIAETVLFEPHQPAIHGPLYPERCPGAPWRLPTDAQFGIWWLSRELGFMGMGYENSVPVYAVADGLLMRRAGWNDAVAIQHPDPLNPGEFVWSVYGGMADVSNTASYVAEAFPPGVEGIPVQEGQLLGYQGRWWDEGPIWVHAHFALTPALDDGSLPAALVGLAGPDAPPLPYQITETGLLDPSPYLGTVRSQVMGVPTWLPMQCDMETQ